MVVQWSYVNCLDHEWIGPKMYLQCASRKLGTCSRYSKRWCVKWMTIRTVPFPIGIIAIVLFLAWTPRNATVDFPMDRREYVRVLYGTLGINGEISRFSANNISTFTGSPGWSIWFSERTILSDARDQGYFCIMEYQSWLGNSWKRSFVQGKCGHIVAYSDCTQCQSISQP